MNSPSSGDERLRERQLDQLALAGPLAVTQAHHRGDRTVDARHRVGAEHVAGELRLRVGVAAEERLADHRLGVGAEGAVVAVRPGQAERRHPDHDEPRVHLAQVVPAEARAVERAGRVVLDHHVADLHQAQERLAALGSGEVGDHRLLVARVGVEVGRAVPAVVLRIEVGVERGQVGAVSRLLLALLLRETDLGAASVRVDAVDWLDADHLGAPLRQQLRAVRAGPDHRRGGYPDALEGWTQQPGVRCRPRRRERPRQ